MRQRQTQGLPLSRRHRPAKGLFIGVEVVQPAGFGARSSSRPEAGSKQQGSFAPRALPRLTATTSPSVTLSPSIDFPVEPVIRSTLLRRTEPLTPSSTTTSSTIIGRGIQSSASGKLPFGFRRQILAGPDRVGRGVAHHSDLLLMPAHGSAKGTRPARCWPSSVLVVRICGQSSKRRGTVAWRNCVTASAEDKVVPPNQTELMVAALKNLPMLWSEQWGAIGLQAPAQVRAELR